VQARLESHFPKATFYEVHVFGTETRVVEMPARRRSVVASWYRGTDLPAD
jgi:hypothetical protein